MARRWFDRLDVCLGDVQLPWAQFSGSNQQKTILAKWLSSPDLRPLILDHPLRGLDVRVAQTVNARIRQASDNGTSTF